MLGYYAALGLDGRRARYVSNEEIKIAFRRLAQTMHPDKFSTADDDDREQAQQAFLKVRVCVCVCVCERVCVCMCVFVPCTLRLTGILRARLPSVCA